MTTAAQWIAGARPRTLPAGFAPVLAGTALAIVESSFQPLLALLCLIISIALQIGVNYANDYSDGIRGTDNDRVGPMRLVGSGAATPQSVRRAAFSCFGIAAVAGLILVILTSQWWLLIVGALAIAAAWFYTGGKRPYGYAGLGEVFVFVFFGLVATGGTALIQIGFDQIGRVWLPVLVMSAVIGLLACNILLANNLRDIPTDTEAGKRTLATRLGDQGTRWLFVIAVILSAAGVIWLGVSVQPWLAIGLAFLLAEIRPVRTLASGAKGGALIPVLKDSGLAELICAVGVLVGAIVASVV